MTMIRLFRANVYRFVCNYWNFVILAAIFGFGIYVAQYMEMYTPQKLWERFANDEYDVIFEILQRNLNLYEATNFDEMVEILYHRQFYKVFYRVAGEAMPFISMVMPSLVICTGLSTRGFRTDCQRTSRMKVLLVRVILTHLITVVVCWLLLVYMLGVYTSWQDYSTYVILRNFLLASIEAVSFGSLTCLIGAILRQPVLGVIGSFTATMVMLKLDLPPSIVTDVNEHLLGEATLAPEIVANLISVLVFFAICTALTVLVSFLSKKVDLK